MRILLQLAKVVTFC